MRPRIVLLGLIFLSCAPSCGRAPRKAMEKYTWAQNHRASPDGRDHGRPCTAEAATITVISSADEARVIEALGIDPATRSMKTFHEAEQASLGGNHPVQVWSSAGRTILVEPYGFQASLADTLKALARGSEAVSVYYSAGSGSQVAVAKDGVLLRAFDPMFDPAQGEGAPLPEEAGLPFGQDRALRSMIPASLLFLERRGGFVASAEVILGERRPTYRLRRR